mmetsp:Transcript_708/g.1217  ORF Transcript_708/g.1217 Transcript_708/m.1217 type:complete len:254 (-) Transcript_708:293-1054(-)|eukprot:CAMPEP_0197632144 /NCGR_PEP_ID=MMETSP1338-20131121/9036_1 /TAXON_ID=43686 ORGANISM="Pelagodinium beii, Strain RCC1491" /NCGR_SAMPLE_ID=MMETSP1338 /ASSEMBLY_ACC=CAM_ASM_000754 /LENGTH=253 /DNA_ID=CAMNT_0043203695 /DNA_START=92 /DNA_END=853 /DNA_ORIENTATION=+
MGFSDLVAENSLTSDIPAKMVYLLRRKPETSFRQMAQDWMKYHIPGVVAGLTTPSSILAKKYYVSLYDDPEGATAPISGGAFIHFLRGPPAGWLGPFNKPFDQFMETMEPGYVGWPTTEHVLLDPSSTLRTKGQPGPLPIQRLGFFKVTVLLAATEPKTDQSVFFARLCSSTGPKLASHVQAAGGFGCVLSVSQQPAHYDFVAMFELYFQAETQWLELEQTCDELRGWDAELIDSEATILLKTTIEFQNIDDL